MISIQLQMLFTGTAEGIPVSLHGCSPDERKVI